MNILLTGSTGNLGPAIAQQLAPHRVFALARDNAHAPEFPNVEAVAGSLAELPERLQPEVEVIIHAAASTEFRAPLEKLRAVNVMGTENVLKFAARCQRLIKVVHVSTACVCGSQQGKIPEDKLLRPAAFINAYEQSKWEAEEVALSFDLPVEIVRLSIVAGSEVDGAVRRPGALQVLLRWLVRGLIPMLPGTPATLVDLVSTEYAAKAVAGMALAPLVPHRIAHGCAGEHAPALGELLDFLTETLAKTVPAWKRGAILPPMIADAMTFRRFEDSVHQSGDALFRRIFDDAQSFLPGLLHPRCYQTATTHSLFGPPSASWKQLANLVIRNVCSTQS